MDRDDDIEKQYKKVQEQLDTVSNQLKDFSQKTLDAYSKQGKVSDEVKEKCDQLISEKNELTARFNALEQKLAELPAKLPMNQVPETCGHQFVNSDAWKEFAGNMNRGSKLTVQLKGTLAPRNALLEGAPSTGGALFRPDRVPGVFQIPNQRLTIRDLLRWGQTQSNDIEFVRETGFTNNADVVSENPSAGKPESTITYEVDSAKIATIAHWMHASKQILSDAPQLQSYIDGRLRYGLALKEELQLLKGSGVGLNINGLFTQAIPYANPGVVVQNETFIDVLRIAILQVELAQYSADGIVMHPTDWCTIELLKDSMNKYLLANPFGTMGPLLWGKPIVPTLSMTKGDFLTGAFKDGAQGWDREQASVTISLEDRDNFIKNMATILGEERVGMCVYRPEAFVKGSLDSDLSSFS